MHALIPQPDDPRRSHPSAVPLRHRLCTHPGVVSGSSPLFFAVSRLIALAILLNNTRFHNYVLRRRRKKASDSLGVRCSTEFRPELLCSHLDVYGVTVDGASPLPESAASATATRRSRRPHRLDPQKKWYLNDIRLDHPVIQCLWTRTASPISPP